MIYSPFLVAIFRSHLKEKHPNEGVDNLLKIVCKKRNQGEIYVKISNFKF
jgi:hypothetical protein